MKDTLLNTSEFLRHLVFPKWSCKQLHSTKPHALSNDKSASMTLVSFLCVLGTYFGIGRRNESLSTYYTLIH